MSSSCHLLLLGMSLAAYNMAYVCLQHCIDDLNLQVDQFESEIEVLLAKKKKLDRSVSEYSVRFSCMLNCYATVRSTVEPHYYAHPWD